jgi:general secretion pathway protein H
MGKLTTSATGSAGFTLIELLVVLIILVLLASAWSFAAPRLLPKQQLRSEAHRLLAALRTARNTARITARIQKVEISQTGAAYSAAGENYPLPRHLTIRMEEDGGTVRRQAVEFLPDGSSNGGRMNLSFAGVVATVNVSPVTGRAELIP